MRDLVNPTHQAYGRSRTTEQVITTPYLLLTKGSNLLRGCVFHSVEESTLRPISQPPSGSQKSSGRMMEKDIRS